MTDDATRTLGKGESPLDSCPRAGGAGWLDVGSGGAVAGPWLADQRSGEEDRGSSAKKTRAKKKKVSSLGPERRRTAALVGVLGRRVSPSPHRANPPPRPPSTRREHPPRAGP